MGTAPSGPLTLFALTAFMGMWRVNLQKPPPVEEAHSALSPCGEEAGVARSATEVTDDKPLSGFLSAALVFLSGAAILVLEIVGMRLIAPYAGVTLQTSTAVISIALAAISAGAWFGGRIADRHDPVMLLPGAFLISAAATAAIVPVVRGVGPHVPGGDTMGVLILAAVTLFLPASLLSVVSPLVVKVRLTNLRHSGTVVGQLSGMGTLGSIAASLITGFVLIAAIPSSTIVWALATVLALVGLVLGLRVSTRRLLGAATGRRVGAVGGLSIVLLVASGGSAYFIPSPCAEETAYQCASIVPDPVRPGGRTLVLNAQRHSYVDLADPEHLQFGYTKSIAAAVDAVPGAGALDVLHLGGGGLTLPGYVAATRAGSRQHVVEIDATLLDLVRQRLTPPLNTSYTVADARVAVAGTEASSADLVIGDAFGHLAAPWHLTTREFVSDIHRVLRPGGTYVLNLIDGPGAPLARSEAATLGQVFTNVLVLSTPGGLKGFEAANFVMVASDGPLPVDRLRAALDAHGSKGTGFIGGPSFGASALPLTDDYAPVDQLVEGL